MGSTSITAIPAGGRGAAGSRCPPGQISSPEVESPRVRRRCARSSMPHARPTREVPALQPLNLAELDAFDDESRCTREPLTHGFATPRVAAPDTGVRGSVCEMAGDVQRTPVVPGPPGTSQRCRCGGRSEQEEPGGAPVSIDPVVVDVVAHQPPGSGGSTRHRPPRPPDVRLGRRRTPVAHRRSSPRGRCPHGAEVGNRRPRRARASLVGVDPRIARRPGGRPADGQPPGVIAWVIL